jgi:hypothetical protein
MAFKAPDLFASKIVLLRSSAIIKNDSGAKGHPYLSLLAGLKNPDADSLINDKD